MNDEEHKAAVSKAIGMVVTCFTIVIFSHGKNLPPIDVANGVAMVLAALLLVWLQIPRRLDDSRRERLPEKIGMAAGKLLHKVRSAAHG